MADWIEFGRGPLFRLSATLMLLGTLRIIFLAIVRRSPHRKNVPSQSHGASGAYHAPAGLWRPVRRVLRPAFHIGLLPVPLFVGAHVLLWRDAVGFAWPGMPHPVADVLTVLMISAGFLLFLGNLFDRQPASGRHTSPAWLLLLLVPFITGYLANHADVSAGTYQWLILAHLYSGNAILLMIPFTRIADCVLSPLVGNVTRSPWNPLGEILGIKITRLGFDVPDPRKES